MLRSSADYPVCLQLQGRDVVVVGGGVVAEGRVVALVEAGAVVTVVAPMVTAALRALADAHKLIWHERVAVDEDVVGRDLAFTATDDVDVSVRLAAAARAAHVWINTADVPALCDFTLPSVGKRGPLTIAVSSNGVAPALSASLRRSLMGHVSRRHVEVARVIGFLRTRLPAGPDRMKTLKSLVDGDAGALLLSGRRREAFAAVRQALSSSNAAGESR